MYHTHKATLIHDKIFALLGMMSHSPSLNLPIDYSISWDTLFHRLIRSLLGETVSITVPKGTQAADIRGMGSVVGKVQSVEYNGQDDQQRIRVLLKDKSEGEGLKSEADWILPPSAKPVLAGDLVCLLEDAAKCIIARLRGDYRFSVIVISAGPPHQQVTSFSHQFSLLWSWDETDGERDEADDRSCESQRHLLARSWRLDAVSVLEDAEKYTEAEEILRFIISDSAAECTEDGLHTLAAKSRLALLWQKANQWGKAKTLLRQEVKIRALIQGASHPDTLQARSSLAQAYVHEVSDEVTPAKQKTVMTLLEGYRGTPPSQEKVAEIAESCDREVVELLLDIIGPGQNVVNEHVLAAAAANELRGEEVMGLLLDRSANTRVTEKVAMAAVRNRWSGKQVLGLIFGKRSNEFTITEGLFAAARENHRQGRDILELLSQQVGGVETTEKIMSVTQDCPSPDSWLQGHVESAATMEMRFGLKTLPPPARNWELIHGEPTLE